MLVEVFRHRRREVAATIAVLLAAFGIDRGLRVLQPRQPQLSQVDRGRLVYTSEGCINCHSQYVRPNTADVLIWGPPQTVAELRERPVVIGNRRQGPDLAEVGTRRSPLWLKAHLYHPSEVSHSSFMPSYSYLFGDDPARRERGDDLIAYLGSLRGKDVDRHLAAEATWQPSPSATGKANPASGKKLFDNYCATCHAADGATRRRWRYSFVRLPPDLLSGPYLRLSASASPGLRIDQIARIVKFGLPGTDMPGHEYLPDGEIASISLWLARNMAQPLQNQTAHNTLGERP